MAASTPDRRIIYRGRKIDLALQTVRLADGSTAQREVVLHRGAVAMVPMVDADHVCLVRNERYTVGRALLEVPAGTIDPGESPDATAARELTEETGYRAGRIARIGEWFVSPGVMNERMYLYLCEDLTPRADRAPARRDSSSPRSSPGMRPSGWSATGGSRMPRRCWRSCSATGSAIPRDSAPVRRAARGQGAGRRSGTGRGPAWRRSR